MAKLGRDEIEDLIQEFYSESGGDLVGLWEIAKEIEERIGKSDTAREQTLEVVEALLAKGLLVGDPPYHAGGYRSWSNQDPKLVLDRIRSQWLELCRTPNIPDIAWFARPR